VSEAAPRSYRFLDDIAVADAAFEARGGTLEDLFVAAADATMNTMVEDLARIRDLRRVPIRVEAATEEFLLFQLLQEIIYYKDAERLLLRVPAVRIERTESGLALTAEAFGEELDPDRHSLLADVKAVTLYRYRVQHVAGGWEATVVLDV
jgi:SHS2 domain-containing protein